MITLELIQKYGPDGWQDEDGVIHYDDQFRTPWGPLGEVITEKTDAGWIIKKAGDVVLFGKGFVKSVLNGPVEDECTAFINDFGFIKVAIVASNGFAVYQVHEDELQWSDIGKVAECYLATLTDSDWEQHAGDDSE